MRNVRRFGGCELEIEKGRVWRNGVEVELTPQQMNVLREIGRAGGKVVDRETLLKNGWPDKVVGPGALDFQVNGVRKRLGEDGKLIETVPGVGYRLQFDPRPKFWRYALVGLAAVLLSAGVFAAIISTGRQPYVSAYHQLTSDGNEKWGPLFTDGRYVYLQGKLNVGGKIVSRFSAVPVRGNGAVEALNIPGEWPCIVDLRPGVEFVIRLDARQGRGLYFLWSRRTGQVRNTGVTGPCTASVSPDGQWIAEPVDLGLLISRFAPNSAARTIRTAGYAPRPQWSGDSERLRFISHDARASAGSLWECKRDGSGVHPVLNAQYRGIGDADWSAGGQLYVFNAAKENREDLWVLRGNGLLQRGAMPLTEGPLSLSEPKLSKDASRLFALGQWTRGELVQFDPKTRAWAPFVGGISALDVNFSRDAQFVAYRRDPEDTLWVSRRDGTGARQLTGSGIEAFQPHWSPDGKRIAFMGHKAGGMFRIYLIDADGGNLVELKGDNGFDQGVPSWSKDGSKIVFGELRYRKPDSEMEVHVIDVATKKETILRDSKGKWSPRWSPDGQYIAAPTSDFNSLTLYDVRAQTWRTLVHASPLEDATWSSDSRFIYFHFVSWGAPRLYKIARIGVHDEQPEIVATEETMPKLYGPWFTVTPEGSLVLLRSVVKSELYALDLAWR